jgi:hypothetical protein
MAPAPSVNAAIALDGLLDKGEAPGAALTRSQAGHARREDRDIRPQLRLGLGISPSMLSRALRATRYHHRAPGQPAMVSPVMAAMAWRMMLGVKFGAINKLGRQSKLAVHFDWFLFPRPCRHDGRAGGGSGTTRRSCRS